MEQLLHYIWKHRIYPDSPLVTTDGQTVEVIDPGLHNFDAGPDFLNAKVRIDGIMWAGSVEIHVKSSDWHAHGHDSDAHYDNVVLHVASDINAKVVTSEGTVVPQLQLSVPSSISDNYAELLQTDRYPPCYRLVPYLSPVFVHSWLSTLQVERLEQKTLSIARTAADSSGSWEQAFFVTLARNYGFGVNSDAFEEWARSIPLLFAARHRDNLFQIEALFLGQAGMLDSRSMPPRRRDAAESDDYFRRLSAEYAFLSRKFSLRPINAMMWRYMRMRPQNFPNIRISQLAWLYHSRKVGLAAITSCATIDEARHMLQAQTTPYWRTHYTFGHASAESDKHLSTASVDVLIINTVVPVMFAYGRHISSESLCERAMEFLEHIKAENNNVIRMWSECGLTVSNAAGSQALIQLKKVYCDRRECLRCRIGYEYLKPRNKNKQSKK